MVRRLVLTAACIDVGYIALFVWLGSWPLTLVNVGSIALYLAAYALIRHRKMPGLTLIWLSGCAHGPGSLLITAALPLLCCCLCPPLWWLMRLRGAPQVALLAYYLGLWARCAITWARWNPWLVNRRPADRQLIHLHCWFVLSAALAGHYRRTVVIAERKLLKISDAGLGPACTNQPFPGAVPGTRWQRASEPRSLWFLLLCDIGTTSNR